MSKAFRCCIYALVLPFGLAFSTQDSQAADNLVNSLQSQWTGVQSISGHITSVGTVGFSNDPDARPSVITSKIVNGKVVAALPPKCLPPVVTMACTEDSGGRFTADWRIAYQRNKLIDPAAGNSTFRDAWDGTTFSELRRSSEYPSAVLSISKTLPDQINAYSSGNSFADPFRFLLQNAQGKTTGLYPTLKMLKDPQTYSNFLETAKAAGTSTLLGHSCKVFELSGGSDVLDGRPIVYRVYLDTSEAFFPIGWDELDSKTSVPLRSYRVSALGNIALPNGFQFKYPKSATITVFESIESSGTSQVKEVYQESIDDLKLNGQNDASVFTIDPGEANFIMDGNNKAIIAVPK
jgi:hypothetical protein